MDPLSNPIKDYAWGSRTAIAGLTGRAAAGPEAEMWLGAHPSGPSRLVRDGAETTLDQVVAADPVGSLGEPSIERFGQRLPYLMKLIAVDQPLSLQVHPTSEQAAEAFARGDSNYSDPWHKPEMICALTPFSGLAGFRPAAQSAMLVERLQVEALQPVVSRLAADDVLGALRVLLEWPGSKRELVDTIVWAAASVHLADYELVCWLARQYPEDPAVLAPLLMHRHELAPGEALYLGAGVLHCYLDGFGVEIMAGSDNVLRAGLTGKRIDVEELLRITVPDAQPLQVVQDGDAYVPPAREFLLRRITSGDGHVLDRAVARIVVCTEGVVTVARQDAEVKLHPGESVFVPASDGPVELSGDGTVFSAEPQV
ncbi:mannose-6-phosphate isomerase, class I [Planotetraspora phitsanulokensis]|uniref:mannose-6-phosphate isomerase n=1 Tax=Planotetraspora phitsanulokensis TaxID=575192 RepID=A0A8J3UJP2_9ACTN|nr:mannose-6-phosphate isomerase, class I [Planotetraspora phitsanulokensis]GII40020.1 putative mannose-6-phosphate isomerase ManA [Planotetraspora phitsanulokensis]